MCIASLRNLKWINFLVFFPRVFRLLDLLGYHHYTLRIRNKSGTKFFIPIMHSKIGFHIQCYFSWAITEFFVWPKPTWWLLLIKNEKRMEFLNILLYFFFVLMMHFKIFLTLLLLLLLIKLFCYPIIQNIMSAYICINFGLFIYSKNKRKKNKFLEKKKIHFYLRRTKEMKSVRLRLLIIAIHKILLLLVLPRCWHF